MTTAPAFPPFVTETGEPRCIHLGCPHAQTEGPTLLCAMHVGFALAMSDMHRRWLAQNSTAPTDVERVDVRLTAVAMVEAAAKGERERIPQLVGLVVPEGVGVPDDLVALTAITAQLAAILVPVVGDRDEVIARLRAAMSSTEHPGVMAEDDDEGGAR
ncbi:hypothetical protein BJ968_000914 [Kineococcus aurantiacus]|uniref:Uncharacterized protein n=2 Tax=Kineococcus aurantiacus TaxID=37633 RepID=A0A7Y9DJ38_9ACTN|nr:hypothetical protein [Kineococcus aurantiacus]